MRRRPHAGALAAGPAGRKQVLHVSAELTRTLLARAEVTDASVLELAPGLGHHTAAEILSRNPRSYVGAESDPNAASLVRHVLAGAATSGTRPMPDYPTPADVVIGEAMLTMQAARLNTRSSPSGCWAGGRCDTN